MGMRMGNGNENGVALSICDALKMNQNKAGQQSNNCIELPIIQYNAIPPCFRKVVTWSRDLRTEGRFIVHGVRFTDSPI